MEFEAFGNKIETLPNGDIKITKPDGSTFVMGKEGVKVDLSSIASVGIQNIFEMKSHVILREGTFTKHKIEFIDGGIVNISYTTEGKLIEFSATNVGQSISLNNEITIMSKSEMDRREKK